MTTYGHTDHEATAPLTRLQRECLAAAAVDELCRQKWGWSHFGECKRTWSGQCVNSLIRRGLLEHIGASDEIGRPTRLRASTYGRRELTRLAKAT